MVRYHLKRPKKEKEEERPALRLCRSASPKVNRMSPTPRGCPGQAEGRLIKQGKLRRKEKSVAPERDSDRANKIDPE